MKVWKVTRRIAGVAGFALLPLMAEAAPITYDFSVTAISGPLSGTTSTGSFTFDTSSIPAVLPGSNDATGLLAALNFTWDGIAYDAGTANTGHLGFDAAGNLIDVLFGTNCGPGPCSIGAGSEEWYVSWQAASSGTFAYSVAGDPVVFSGTSIVSVGEPASIALLAFGLGGLGAFRRRRS